jgi:hypothetical protein
MFTDYLIITASITAVTILWRTVKDDRPRFKEFVRGLPLIGEPLSCGVCVSFWFSLPVVLVFNPLALWQPYPLLNLLCGWLCVSIGVLLLRSLIIVLLEAGATLKHRHHDSHNKN